MSLSEAYHLSPHTAQLMALSLLRDFGRLAQKKDQRQLIEGCALSIAAKLSESERAERSCKHCGKRLASWNKGDYCTQHRRPCDRAKRFCKEPGCGKRLRSDTPGELCLEHRLPSIEPQFCKAIVNGEKCGNQLYANNTTGFCVIHHHLSRHPEAWKPCKEPGCPHRVRSTNEHGYCREHRFANHRPSVTGKPRFCTKCVEARDSAPLEPLAVDNKSGLCNKHIYLKYRPPVGRKTCQAAKIIGPGNECTAVLGANNKSGLCAVHSLAFYRLDPEHRAAAARRQQEFRARRAGELAQAKADAKTAKAEVYRLTEVTKPKPVGRPVATTPTKKQEQFIAAAKLYDRLKSSNPRASWPAVAQRVAPEEYKIDPEGVAGRLRHGAKDIRKKFPELFSVS